MVSVRGLLVVAGGFLVHITLGTGFTFGNMSPYIVSYLRHKGHNVTTHDAIWVYAMVVFGQGLLMTVGGLLEVKLGPRIPSLLGTLIASVGVAVTYFTINTSLGAVVATYGLLFGLGISIAYMPPMASGMKWFPEDKGLVNGIIVGGFGFGAFIFTQVQTAYLNPHNRLPGDDGFFTDETVLAKVPQVFLLLGVIYGVLQLIGCCVLVNPPVKTVDEIPLVDAKTFPEPAFNGSIKETSYGTSEIKNVSSRVAEKEKTSSTKVVKPPKPKALPPQKCLQPMEVLHTSQFYVLWFTMFLNNQIIIYVNSMYKAYGQSFIKDDQFLATVGAVAAIFNSSGRVFWGWVLDKSSYKICMVIVTGSVCILMATLVLTQYGGKFMFAVWIWAIFLFGSGTYALLPTCTALTFGIKHSGPNYGLVFSNTVISSPLVAMLTQGLYEHLRWSGLFTLLASFSFFSMLVTMFFKER